MSSTEPLPTAPTPAPGLLDRFGVKEILAMLSVIALITAMLLFWYKAPDPSNQILIGLIGQLSAIVLVVYNNYFGSTAQSKAKDDTIAALSNAKSTPTETK